ncbi:hypothetical protein [Ferrimonas aestuarii]|uniref:Uncharacterized protein n=1 Tax=Ferrimonas aestuarii TaxID=2569539 RepID=A0A4U1BS11_9GAMM|nr:hypothetical protein [Ferrimonas aestuarii]TKB57600.1 hypothetical protein FCL42_04825 [Ferrimonas aestuarii]
MRMFLATSISIALLSGCVAVPVEDYGYLDKCETFSKRKELAVVDVVKETNSYFSISSFLMSPITVSVTGILSGSYVVVNNTYHFGEELVRCEEGET